MGKLFCIHTASEHFDSYVKLVPFSCRAFISNPESCPQREKETMNKITQITIKKREKNQHFSFISTRPRHKLNRRVGLNCTATYVISTIAVVYICISKQALMKQNNGGEEMNILATWKKWRWSARCNWKTETTLELTVRFWS